MFLALETAKVAKYLNNPTSSKKMDKIVIEKNKTKILIGLIALLLVQEETISLTGQDNVITKSNAPNKAIIQ